VLSSAGILIGIKVDRGAKPLAAFPGETITEGLDGLRQRMQAYAGMGARFAKWRAVFSAEEGAPNPACIKANAHALARYAALSQEAGLVPIVEPELMMEGTHDIDYCARMTQIILEIVFHQLSAQRVLVEGMILKPNMVLAGLNCPVQPSVEEIADATMQCLLRSVPAALPGIAFLSGGQSPELTSARLNAINARFKAKAPWALSFSYARAIQQPALGLWAGEESHVGRSQASLLHRVRCNRSARRGEYDASTDSAF
jgi:fructose-bisphosphate aldolase class I